MLTQPARWPNRALTTWRGLGPALRRLMLVTALYTAIAGAGLPYEAVYLGSRFGVAPAMIGALSTAIGIVSLPIQLFGGHLSDRWGRRPLLLLGTAGGTLGCLAFALAPSLLVAVLGYVLLGLGFSLFFPITQAMAADVASSEGHPGAFAWVYAAVGVGWAVGTVLAGVAGNWSYALLFGVGAALGVVAVIAAVLAGETASHERRRTASTMEIPANVWQDPSLLGFGALLLGVWLVGGQLLVTLPLWIVDYNHYPIAFFGVLMASNGVLIAVGQVALSGSTRRFPTAAVLAVGSLGFGAGYALMALRSAPALVIGTLLFTVGEMLIVPTTSAALERLAPRGRGGQYQGAGAMLQGLGATVGPLPGGVLLQFGGALLWWICLGWCGLCAAGYLVYGRRRSLD